MKNCRRSLAFQDVFLCIWADLLVETKTLTVPWPWRRLLWQCRRGSYEPRAIVFARSFTVQFTDYIEKSNGDWEQWFKDSSISSSLTHFLTGESILSKFSFNSLTVYKLMNLLCLLCCCHWSYCYNHLFITMNFLCLFGSLEN